MNEAIYFPENKISAVVAVIRRGLRDEKDAELVKQFERQCVELERCWNRWGVGMKMKPCVCPKCKSELWVSFNFLWVSFNFDSWFFVCCNQDCGWKSQHFENRRSPDDVKQKELKK